MHTHIEITSKKTDNSIIVAYTYTLDDFGNHLQEDKTEPIIPSLLPEDTNYTVDDANRLSLVGSDVVTYDDRGNLSQIGNNHAFDYDYADRMVQTVIDGQTVNHTYDGLGNRIRRTVDGVEIRYTLDLKGKMSQVLSEANSSNAIQNYYVYGHGLISHITPGGERYCYHYDSRGSTIAITDHAGNVVNSYAYDEFGQVLAENETFNNPFKYVGKYGVMDEGNGLLFMRARFYDTATGKFLNKDPLGFDGGDLNLYAYVGGDPTMRIDPIGLFKWYGNWGGPNYSGGQKGSWDTINSGF